MKAIKDYDKRKGNVALKSEHHSQRFGNISGTMFNHIVKHEFDNGLQDMLTRHLKKHH